MLRCDRRDRPFATRAPLDAPLRHLDHRSPQDGDLRLDRRPDRDRRDRRHGRLRLLAKNSNFRRPTRTEAYELLEDRLPGAVGRHARRSSSRPTAGSNRRRSRRRWKASSRSRQRPAHVSEVASPYAGGGAGAISKDGKIAYATVQYDVQEQQARQSETPKSSSTTAQGAAGDGLQVELGGQPIEEAEPKKTATPPSRSACWPRSSSCCSPSARWSRWACRSSPRCSRSASGSAWSRSAPTSSTPPTSRRVLAAMIGLGVGIDYALFILTRFRNGLDEGSSRARRRSPPSTPPAARCSSPGSP